MRNVTPTMIKEAFNDPETPSYRQDDPFPSQSGRIRFSDVSPVYLFDCLKTKDSKDQHGNHPTESMHLEYSRNSTIVVIIPIQESINDEDQRDEGFTEVLNCSSSRSTE